MSPGRSIATSGPCLAISLDSPSLRQPPLSSEAMDTSTVILVADPPLLSVPGQHTWSSTDPKPGRNDERASEQTVE
jgi:hypothetical protein